MKVQDHLGKISWTLGNKFVIILFGFITFFQIKMMDPSNYGLWYILLSINQWIMLVSTNFALQGIVQYGIDKKTRAKADFLSMVLHSGICIASAVLICIVSWVLSRFFDNHTLDKIDFYLFFLILANILRYYVLKFFQRDYRYKEYFWVDAIYYAVISVFIFYRLFTSHIILVEEAVWVFVIAELASSFLGFLLIGKELKFSIHGSPSIKEFMSFSLPMALHSLIFSIPRRLDVVIAKLFFSLADIGLYATAKTLFRVFEETGFAAQALNYSASKKMINENDSKSIGVLLKKGTSVMFVSFLFAAIVLNLGLSEYLIKLFLPPKFLSSIAQFNLLVFAALMIPFSSMNVIIISEGKSRLVMQYALEGLLCLGLVFAGLAYFDLPHLLPLGYGLYLLYYGIRCYLYMHKEYAYSFRTIFSAVPDGYNFLKQKLVKK